MVSVTSLSIALRSSWRVWMTTFWLWEHYAGSRWRAAILIDAGQSEQVTGTQGLEDSREPAVGRNSCRIP